MTTRLGRVVLLGVRGARRTPGRWWPWSALAVGLALTLSAPTALAQTPALPIVQAPVVPMPSPGAALLPGFVGAPAAAHPFYEPTPPRNPFMAANGTSEIHDDGYQSDTYQISGPLGQAPRVTSAQVNGECASVTFDRRGRIVSVCVGLAGPELYMLDPVTLATLATFPLPPRQPSAGAVNPFSDFGGGGYFYLDQHDRAVIPTTTRHVYVVSEANAAFALQRDYDLSSVIASGDKITSALPDWSGHLWFESFNGVLGTIDLVSGAVHTLALGEETENSFAVDEHGGVFVVSIKALYRLHADGAGLPKIDWRSVYPNSGIHEPGQVDAGSGTTPTVQGDYVTITDNANPIEVVAYRRDNGRQVCAQPVFGRDQSADENSVIGAGNMMIVENNYGYSGPAAVQNGGVTAPGIERVDINANGRGCHVVWINNTERVPTAVSKVSLASGLLYTYTKDDTSPLDPWYFTALDAGSGRLVYRQLAGTGLGYNNNYAPVSVGPDGAAYVGVLGGLVEIRDAVAPNLPAPSAPVRRAHARARLLVTLLDRRHVRVRVRVTGGAVDLVLLRLAAARRVLARPPFSASFGLSARQAGRLRVVAVVDFHDGSTLRLTATVRVPASFHARSGHGTFTG